MGSSYRSAVLAAECLYAAVTLLCLFAVCVEIGDAASAVDVYRMIQYDLAGVPLGSRRAALNHYASSVLYSNASTPPDGVDLSRAVVIMPVAKLNLTLLADYLHNKHLLGGLLLLLPLSSGVQDEADNDADADDDNKDLDYGSHTVQVERWLIHNNIPFPVYFAYENDKLKAIYNEVVENDATGKHATALSGGYKLVVSVPEPRKLPPATFTTMQGWLPGLRGGDVSQLPTIAIVASYDTFGASPALSVGSDSNGSGVVAVLELARLFSRLYANMKTRGKFNLLFGLTAGGPYDYDGSAKWLRSFDQRLRESVDYALCLNSIGSGADNLWMHVSKPPDNPLVKRIFDDLTTVGQGLGISVGIKHKKINISNSRVAWEHEQFSRQRITAATLSGMSSPPEFLEHAGGINDRREQVKDAILIKKIKVIAESLSKHIYGLEGKQMEVFADNSTLAVNPSYVRLWLDFLSRSPRVVPFLSKNDPIISALKKELTDHTSEANYQQDLMDPSITFYDLSKAQLSIYQVASVTFDLIVLAAVGIYLSLLFVTLVLTTKGMDEFVCFFRRPPSRKVKVA